MLPDAVGAGGDEDAWVTADAPADALGSPLASGLWFAVGGVLAAVASGDASASDDGGPPAPSQADIANASATIAVMARPARCTWLSRSCPLWIGQSHGSLVRPYHRSTDE